LLVSVVLVRHCRWITSAYAQVPSSPQRLQLFASSRSTGAPSGRRHSSRRARTRRTGGRRPGGSSANFTAIRGSRRQSLRIVVTFWRADDPSHGQLCTTRVTTWAQSPSAVGVSRGCHRLLPSRTAVEHASGQAQTRYFSRVQALSSGCHLPRSRWQAKLDQRLPDMPAAPCWHDSGPGPVRYACRVARTISPNMNNPR
jgi:hypothetical protein